MGSKKRVGGQQPWYATQEGRAEFGRRCAERDAQPEQPERDFILEQYSAKPNEYRLCLERARTEKSKAREAAKQAGDWWRIASMWIDGDIFRDQTHNEVMRRLLISCPDWYLYSQRYIQTVNARWLPYRDLMPDDSYRILNTKKVLDEMVSWVLEEDNQQQCYVNKHPSASVVYSY